MKELNGGLGYAREPLNGLAPLSGELGDVPMFTLYSSAAVKSHHA